MSSTECGSASLTTKGLDVLGLAMLAIPDERVDVSISDPEVQTLLIGTGKILGVYAFGSSALAFDLTPGTDWRRRRFLHRRVGATEAAVGAVKWGAWLEKAVYQSSSSVCL
jgi:hypothetical protein